MLFAVYFEQVWPRINIHVNGSTFLGNAFASPIIDLKTVRDRKLNDLTAKGDINACEYCWCVSIPYTSTDNEKHVANGAMLQEWLRYYLKLNMKVTNKL